MTRAQMVAQMATQILCSYFGKMSIAEEGGDEIIKKEEFRACVFYADRILSLAEEVCKES